MYLNIQIFIIWGFCWIVKRHEDLISSFKHIFLKPSQIRAEQVLWIKDFHDLSYRSRFPCFHNRDVWWDWVCWESNTVNSKSRREEGRISPWFPNIVGIVLIVVDARCIPVVETFFSNIRTYFCLNIIRTL